MTIHFLASKPHLKPIFVSESEAKDKNLMQLLLAAKLQVASSCKGDGICSKCRVHVIVGLENTSVETELEIKTKRKNRVDATDRLSCQVFLKGDVTIDTSYW